jgi:sulfite reductase (NADPH) hemoprotein beta-component
VVRVYNRWGRRDNMYKARIKILVKAEGQRYIDEVEAEFRAARSTDGAPHTISQAELTAWPPFVPPALQCTARRPTPRSPTSCALPPRTTGIRPLAAAATWHPHKNPDLRAVTLSFKRLGQPPGDATADQMDKAAELADQFSRGELRVTHDQNLLLPWVRCDAARAVAAAREAGFATPNIGLLTDMIACPGGDLCALANARSLPMAAAITERFDDLDELHDIGDIDLHISGCINSCGHHHSGHIGILGVDKDGRSGTRSRWAAPTAPR